MTEGKQRRMANPRSPAAVMQDLAEAEAMIREVRKRYSHAYDLAYSLSSGTVATGGSKGDLKYARPTEDAAINAGKDRARGEVARAGRAAKRLVGAAHEMHSALVNAMPGTSAYQPAWRPSDRDPIATRAEREETRQRQQERAQRGEL